MNEDRHQARPGNQRFGIPVYIISGDVRRASARSFPWAGATDQSVRTGVDNVIRNNVGANVCLSIIFG
jgi:hypothetical protein